MYLQEVDRSHRARTCRTGPAVQERDLAKHLSGLKEIKDRLLALGGDGVNTHSAHQYAAERIAGIAFGEDLVARLKVANGREFHQPVEQGRGSVAKQHVPREQRAKSLGWVTGHPCTSPQALGEPPRLRWTGPGNPLLPQLSSGR